MAKALNALKDQKLQSPLKVYAGNMSGFEKGLRKPQPLMLLRMQEPPGALPRSTTTFYSGNSLSWRCVFFVKSTRLSSRTGDRIGVSSSPSAKARF
jgi:hypothetical protein